jgi:hypothetical protein
VTRYSKGQYHCGQHVSAPLSELGWLIVDEASLDNIDYNEIKHLIKVRTTKDQAQSITVPGHENEARALQDFEDELYNELRQQHQRIDLFVQSKSGEIARRLSVFLSQDLSMDLAYIGYQQRTLVSKLLN